MTQGVLLFAHDNEQIQYGLLAVWQALRIQKWLDRPVSLVADQNTIDNLGVHKNVFDNIIISNESTNQKKNYNGRQLTFNNIDRSNAWELTPYNETLVIDTDIVIQSDRLNTIWNTTADMLVCRQSTDVFGRPFVNFDKVSAFGVNFIWATEFYFKKNETTNLFFNLCKEIKEKYEWYSYVHGITKKYIRNDHVWSIALHQLNGDWAMPLPFNLYYTIDRDNIINMTDDSIVLLGDNKVANITRSDVHVMNKFDLLSYVKKELNV
jgi:hypothetical protein